MGKIAPPREAAFLNYFKALRVESLTPLRCVMKRAVAGTFTPLQIVDPTNETIPPRFRDILINNSETTIA